MTQTLDMDIHIDDYKGVYWMTFEHEPVLIDEERFLLEIRREYGIEE